MANPHARCQRAALRRAFYTMCGLPPGTLRDAERSEVLYEKEALRPEDGPIRDRFAVEVVYGTVRPNGYHVFVHLAPWISGRLLVVEWDLGADGPLRARRMLVRPSDLINTIAMLTLEAANRFGARYQDVDDSGAAA